MARLFISYSHKEAPYAYAVRQWLIDEQQWVSEDIFLDSSHLYAGVDWERKLLAEAEAAEVMLFLASDHSLNIDSYCYRELKHATGQIIAVTIGGVPFDDQRLDRALPQFAKSRQVTALDQEPAQEFSFISPRDNKSGTARLNAKHLYGIGQTLRELGVAPNSYTWTPTAAGPYPGLRPLMEGDEAIFCGRELEIRDGIKAIEDLRSTVTKKALIIQAPSGAGKSSFLRAGLWRRLRRNPGFTSLAVIRTQSGAVRHSEWGLITGLVDTLSKSGNLGKNLLLSRDEIASRAQMDLAGLLAAFADADKTGPQRRTLLLGIDQAEEMTALSTEDDVELDGLLQQLLQLPDELNLLLVFTARDDSVDATLERLFRSGLSEDQVATWRLHRLPPNRFDNIITGPAVAAKRAGWHLTLDPSLVDALVKAASAGGEGGDALPILALTLQRMVSRRRQPNGQISLSAQDAASFLEGAVSESTRDALRAASATAEDLRRLVIPRLATWDPRAGAEGAARRQVASASDLFAGSRAGLKPLAEALVEQRLLTRSHTESGPAYEVAHEALLRVRPLGQLILDCREKFEQARILEIETREWDELGKPSSNLLRNGERLKNAFELLNDPDFGTDLKEGMSSQVAGGSVADYLKACRDQQEVQKRNDEARQKRSRAVRRAVTFFLSLLAILATTGAIFGWIQTRTANERLRVARFNDGQGALLRSQVAHQNRNRFPDRLFHAARASGFDGFGRAAHTPPRSQAGLRLPFLGDDNERFPILVPLAGTELCHAILKEGAYLPFWKTEALGGGVDILAVSSDGRRVAAAFEDGSIRVWDFAGADPQKSLAERLLHQAGSPACHALSYSTKGLLAAATSQGVLIWPEGKDQPQVLSNGRATALAWKADGDLLAVGFSDGSIQLFDPAKATSQIFGGHMSEVTSLSFSADQTTLANGAVDGSLWLWDLSGRERSVLIEKGPRVTAIAFSPAGNLLAAALDDAQSIRLWDAGNQPIPPLPMSEKQTATRALAFRPDGKLLATGHEASDQGGYVQLWSTEQPESPREVATLNHPMAVRSLAFAPCGSALLTGSPDGTLLAWDVAGTKDHFDTEKRNDLSLQAYFDRRWYDFDQNQEITPGKGFGGLINLPVQSTLGIWATVPAAEVERRLFDRLLQAENWNGAVSLVSRLGMTGDETSRLALLLTTEARKAQAAYSWNLARLRLQQLECLGAPLPPEVKEKVKEVEGKMISPETPRNFTNGEGMEMIWCPRGVFPMGSPESETGRGKDETLRLVELTQGFWISKFEVTQELWQKLMNGSNPSSFRTSGLKAPVEQVSWEDAMAFCLKLTEREMAKGAIPKGWEYTLPTEAQWEYSCRAGDFKFPGIAGDSTPLGEYVWYQENSENRTHEVGTRKPNSWGIHDMGGNVAEWCRDWHSQYYYEPVMRDPAGFEDGFERVIRGGSWDGTANSCRPAFRHWSSPAFRSNYVGFRPVLFAKRNEETAYPFKKHEDQPSQEAKTHAE